MVKWIISPPAVFIGIFLVLCALSRLFSKISAAPKRKTNEGGEAYACGESNYDHTAHPDYSNFFSFAFFFTLAHVATLIMTTVPLENLRTLVIAGIYITCAVTGLYILFRK